MKFSSTRARGITPDFLKKILSYLKEGYSLAQAARKFRVNKNSISIAISNNILPELTEYVREGPYHQYRPEICDQVLELMKQGFTATAAAGKLGIHNSVISKWKNDGEHPKFTRAVMEGAGYRQYVWEKRLMNTELPPCAITATIFALKSTDPENWSDRKTVNHTSSDGSMSPPNRIVYEFTEATSEEDDQDVVCRD